MKSVAAPPLSERSWVRQFNGLRWADGRGGVLVNDLRAGASDKLDSKAVK
jgi:hypothetical protein